MPCSKEFLNSLSFSFTFPPAMSAIWQFHYYKHVLHINVYMIIFVFVYTFIFWLYLLYMRKNMTTLAS
jgi:hypothetical protein